MSLEIDCQFIKKWHPLYDCTETDQKKYDSILSIVVAELGNTGTLTRETFIRIIDWKASRVKGKLDAEYGPYSDAFRLAHSTKEVMKKLKYLIALPGIGVPVASTILHFMEPADIPINDFRTVEILHFAGLIQFLSRDEKRFGPFRDAILSIKRRCPEFSLRQIDRALFAYHKQDYVPHIKGKSARSSQCRRK